MKLLVDIGNSRVKWACSEHHSLSAHGSFAYTTDSMPDRLAQHWRSLAKPQQVYLASVADDEVVQGINAFMWRSWSLQGRAVVPEKECRGLKVAYEDVAAMGVDRWLAMLAAWSRFKAPLCIIDCGTAVTVDIIMQEGEHIGGFILPGYALMSQVLRQKTQRINSAERVRSVLEPGRSTQACIANGYALALIALLERCIREMHTEGQADLLLVITGGGAGRILPLLPDDHIHAPHLVLEGLHLLSSQT